MKTPTLSRIRLFSLSILIAVSTPVTNAQSVGTWTVTSVLTDATVSPAGTQLPLAVKHFITVTWDSYGGYNITVADIGDAPAGMITSPGHGVWYPYLTAGNGTTDQAAGVTFFEHVSKNGVLVGVKRTRWFVKPIYENGKYPRFTGYTKVDISDLDGNVLLAASGSVTGTLMTTGDSDWNDFPPLP